MTRGDGLAAVATLLEPLRSELAPEKGRNQIIGGGEMSLVGPRRLIPEQHGHLADWGLRRLDLKPGMTGPWQVLGCDRIGFGEMVGLDYFCVTTWSLWNDIRWPLRAFSVVAKGEHQPPSFPPATSEL